MDSILNSIKKLLGLTEEQTNFDTDIVIHINSVFMILNQLGVGPKECFAIYDANDTWGDFIQNDVSYEALKSYIYFKVKLLFDPPLSSSVLSSMERMISEFEWRLNVQAENKQGENQNGEE